MVEGPWAGRVRIRDVYALSCVGRRGPLLIYVKIGKIATRRTWSLGFLGFGIC